MSTLTPILTFHKAAEATANWAAGRLQASGFQVERTFDLRSARRAHPDCPCPYHGTNDCSCQMAVLFVRNQKGQSATMIIHGYDDQTSLSLVDGAGQSMNESICQILLPAIEN